MYNLSERFFMYNFITITFWFACNFSSSKVRATLTLVMLRMHIFCSNRMCGFLSTLDTIDT